jgi:hypothetical protein
MIRVHISVKVGLATVLLTCASSAQAPPTPKFEDISKQAGLTVTHIAEPEQHYIVESTSGGVGFIDCDNDGKLDIVVVNSSTVDRFRQGGDPMVTLYHQGENLQFTDITKTAGLTRKGWGMGVAVADFDNDGWQDLYVTGFGGNALYRNLGNCKFEDITERAGVQVGGYSTGAAWGDFDRDGYVDLFVPRYLSVDLDKLPKPDATDKMCAFQGLSMECARRGHTGESDFLFHNRGNGTFEDVSKKAGVDDPGHYLGMQGIWTDYDNDGWPDLYVTNDGGPNFLYHNKHDGTFEDVGLFSGAALSLEGQERGSMGVDAGDFDQDGHFDFLVTNFTGEANALYWNQGERGFTDLSWPAGIAKSSSNYVGWGTSFFDMDNDGWVDLLVANGQVFPQMDNVKSSGGYRQPLLLFRNQRNRTFEDVTALAGLDKLPLASRRGAAFGDVNNDGKVDVLLLNVGQPPTLLLNRTESGNHAMMFQLVGTKSNRSAIGARVIVHAGDLREMNEVRSGSSYCSQNDLRLHFGLGSQTSASSVEVWWPSGAKDTYKDLAADFIYTIVEGKGVTNKTSIANSSSDAGRNASNVTKK